MSVAYRQPHEISVTAPGPGSARHKHGTRHAENESPPRVCTCESDSELSPVTRESEPRSVQLRKELRWKMFCLCT